MDSVADLQGLVVAYPDGARSILGRQSADWNAGSCCGYAQRQNVDDVGFLRAIIDDVSSRTAIDPARVYVAGFSDGGRMAYRAGCELADRVAAIAVVAGSLTLERCTPARAVSLLAIHGTRDNDVAYDETPAGAPAGADGTPAASAGAPRLPPSVITWGRLAACTGAAPSRPDERDSRATIVDLTGCANADVTLISLRGGGHEWPRPPDTGTSVPRKLPASAVIVDFLLRHRR